MDITERPDRAARKSMIEAYQRLKSHNANHPLLKYISKTTDNDFLYSLDNKIMEEFVEKFVSGNSNIADIHSRYCSALRAVFLESDRADRREI